MRKAINIFFVATVSIFILAACNNSGSNHTSEKELEHQKRELDLKQKELELKEKELSQQQSKPSTTPPANKTATSAPSTTNTTTDNSVSTVSYNFAGHGDFQSFWTDFKKATLTGDKDAVLLMTNFPFEDDELANGTTGELSCNNSSAFLSKYNRILNSKCIAAINKNNYRGWSNDDLDGMEDVLSEGEFLLNVNYSDVRYQNIVFSKKNGKYMLTRIQYYP